MTHWKWDNVCRDEKLNEGENHLQSSKKIDKKDIEAKVKSAIDRFDPFVFCPGQDAPADEYDGESKRIAEKLYFGMSKQRIAEIIAEEFTRSFEQTFTKEECSLPALEIYKKLSK